MFSSVFPYFFIDEHLNQTLILHELVAVSHLVEIGCWGSIWRQHFLLCHQSAVPFGGQHKYASYQGALHFPFALVGLSHFGGKRLLRQHFLLCHQSAVPFGGQHKYASFQGASHCSVCIEGWRYHPMVPSVPSPHNALQKKKKNTDNVSGKTKIADQLTVSRRYNNPPTAVNKPNCSFLMAHPRCRIFQRFLRLFCII